jgi:S-adenosylmethionine decarboxylase proenzyme
MSAPNYAFRGRHVLAELYDAPAELLNNEHLLRDALQQGLDSAGVTTLGVLAHKFEPNGVTIVAMLAESHASIHTYPESGAAFVDVFTCGTTNPLIIFWHLAELLEPIRLNIHQYQRGVQPANALERNERCQAPVSSTNRSVTA